MATYDEEKELTNYVWRNLYQHIPMLELKAFMAAHNKPPSQCIEPDIREALANGVGDLRSRVAHVIAKRPDVVIKRCNICKKIMRTPEARICLWCD